jgi:hypothetical protein
MFWLILWLAFIYIPVIGAAIAAYRKHPFLAAGWAFAITSLWLWMIVSLATS